MGSVAGVGAAPAGVVAGRRFYFHDIGAVVGQQTPAKGGPAVGQIQDAVGRDEVFARIAAKIRHSAPTPDAAADIDGGSQCIAAAA